MNMRKEQFNKKQFRTAIRALYKINEKPEEKRTALRRFYDEHEMDEITLYKRYRQLKYCCGVEDSAFLGGLVGIFLTVALRPFELLQNVDLRQLIGHPFVAFLLGATALIAALVIVLILLLLIKWFLRAFMSMNRLLVYPYEISILEEELHIYGPKNGGADERADNSASEYKVTVREKK